MSETEVIRDLGEPVEETPRERERREAQEAADVIAAAGAEELKDAGLRLEMELTEGPRAPGRTPPVEPTEVEITAAADALMDANLRADSSPIVGPRNETRIDEE